MKLWRIDRWLHIQMQSIDQNQFGYDDSASLKIQSLPSFIFECLDIEQSRFEVKGCLGETPLEIGEEWWVIERPFRCFLQLLSEASQHLVFLINIPQSTIPSAAMC